MDQPDEKTPVEGLGQWGHLFQRLDAIEITCQHSADNTLATRTMIENMVRDIQRLRSRVTALELERTWFPLLLSTLAVGLSLWALLRHA